MPIYEYRCATGHTFETFQSMSDEPVEICEFCEAPVERVLSAPAIHFKGSGFYTTDYKRKGAAANGDGKGDSAKKESGGGEKDAGKSSAEKKSSGGEKAGKGSGSSE